MKPIPIGHQETLDIVVSEAMTVDFEQDDPRLGKLHPVYATYWLTKHFELVSRKIILSYLEKDEEGIGFEVSVKHLASAIPGMRIRLSSRHEKTVSNRVYVFCEAHSELGDKIGEGHTVQVILTKEKLNKHFTALQKRWESYRG